MLAVMKMMGVCSERLRWRIKAAVSNPSNPGIITSRRMTAKSSRRRCRERVEARGCGHQGQRVVLDDGGEGRKLVGKIIHQQDLDLLLIDRRRRRIGFGSRVDGTACGRVHGVSDHFHSLGFNGFAVHYAIFL